MAQDALTIAWRFMRRRKFATAIKLLEARQEIYEDNFEYYVILGIACLYVGDIGSSSSYFQRARKIKLTDTRLLWARLPFSCVAVTQTVRSSITWRLRNTKPAIRLRLMQLNL